MCSHTQTWILDGFYSFMVYINNEVTRKYHLVCRKSKFYSEISNLFVMVDCTGLKIQLLWLPDCSGTIRIIEKTPKKLINNALTVLTVPSHVLSRAFAGIVCNQVCANTAILAWIPFTFVDIWKNREKKGAFIYSEQTCRQQKDLIFIRTWWEPVYIEFSPATRCCQPLTKTPLPWN